MNLNFNKEINISVRICWQCKILLRFQMARNIMYLMFDKFGENTEK